MLYTKYLVVHVYTLSIQINKVHVYTLSICIDDMGLS